MSGSTRRAFAQSGDQSPQWLDKGCSGLGIVPNSDFTHRPFSVELPI